METENKMSSKEALVLNEEIRAHLLESAKWAKFLAVLGYIMITLMVLMLLSFFFFFSKSSRFSENEGLTIFPFLMICIYYLPIRFLYQYAQRIKVAVRSNDLDVLTSAFKSLKLHYKVIAIIIISFFALMLLPMFNIFSLSLN